MKKRITAIITAALILSCMGSLTGCSGSISDLEKQVSNTIGNVTSSLENNVVTSTWNEVNKTETKMDASKLNSTLKNFYTGIVSGTINEDTSGYLVTATLPAGNASNATRKQAANELTVFSAVEWQGMQSLYTEEYISNFLYGGGEVVPKTEQTAGEYKPFTLDTKLGTIYAA